MKIAFVGVGAIGTPMARRLVEHSHHVTVFDINPERTAQLATYGAHVAQTATDAVAGAEAVVVMVATPQQLHAAVLGPNGAAPGLAEGTTVIVMSTVGAEAVKAVAETLSRQGVLTLDAPVTGGVVRAETGELTILVGGDRALEDRFRHVLTSIGTNIVHCGDAVGDGQSVKLVNQLLCSVHLAVAGEALEFARTLGLDPATVLDTIGGGAAHSFMLTDRGPRMLADNPPVKSSVDIFVKDSSLVVAAAAASGATIPLLATAAAQFAAASAAGLGARDDSAVITTFASDPPAHSR